MIDSQLRTSGVNAPLVIERMGSVPRENYVPATARGTAYMDRAIRLDNGNALPAPLVHGLLLQEAAPDAQDRAIVVDCGAGYLAELLRPLVGELTVLSPEEAANGKQLDTKANLLLIDGAAEQVPAALLSLLEDGARIVTGIIEGGVTRIAIGRKTGDSASLFAVHDVGMPRLAAFDAPKGWSF